MATSRKNSSNTSNKKGAGSSSSRRSPGSGGQGEYYHIELRPGEDFETFRTQDVGDPGHIQRVGGKRSSGSWATVKWLISKEDAHMEGDRLVPDSRDAQILLKKLGPRVSHKSGDRFEARPRRSVSDKPKPAAAQKTKTRGSGNK